jgi:hypothetical protein
MRMIKINGTQIISSISGIRHRLNGFTQIFSVSDYLENQRHQRSNTNCGKL